MCALFELQDRRNIPLYEFLPLLGGPAAVEIAVGYVSSRN